MQVIDQHDIPEVEAPELPAPQSGPCSLCLLIFRQQFVNSEVKQLYGKHIEDIIRPEKLATLMLLLMTLQPNSLGRYM